MVIHLPREISRLAKFYLEYVGALTTTVRKTKFRRPPILQRGLEMPISLAAKKSKAKVDVYNKMKEYISGLYMNQKIFLKKQREKTVKMTILYNCSYDLKKNIFLVTVIGFITDPYQ